MHIIEEWVNNLVVEAYVMTHLNAHTILMTNNDKNTLYGIKSITSDIADMLPQNYLPIMGEFILLPFMGNIIYDGFCNLYNVSFGTGIRKDLTSNYNHSKAINGIYSEYKISDDLSNPPSTSTVQEMVKYSISKSLKRGQFPQEAFNLADHKGMRDVFEKEYTAHYLKHVKRNLRMNNDIPKMYYAAYRESIIGVMPTKKGLENFCKENYKNIAEYITILTV